ncbi:MAG TPA: winged helix-turn-helix transcriptional regulator [Geobacteraceae bacterium]
MNANDEKSLDSYRSYLLMTEIDHEEPLSQRELARRLGIAVGLVNSYLKNLVGKGFVRIKAFPKNRYSYLLTPQGLAEKSRLAYQHLSYFTGLYTVARQDYLALFRRLEAAGVRQVVFCGVDEVAEIAYLSLREADLNLLEVYDDVHVGKAFFGKGVKPLSAITELADTLIVITSMKRRDALFDELSKYAIDNSRILFPVPPAIQEVTGESANVSVSKRLT